MKLTSKSTVYALIFGILYPFFGFLYSLWDFRKPYAKVLYYIFCLFVGYSFIYEGGAGMDGGRYAEELVNAHANHLTWNECVDFHGSVDFYSGTIVYILSRFTGNPQILFLVYAAIMGYFLIRNLWFVLDRLNGTLKYPTIILIVLLIFICPIWLINGVRMWTALHIFVYGVFRYMFEQKKTFLWWSLLSIFVHFSFVIPFFLLLIYILIPIKNIRYFFYFFFVSFFIREIDLVFFRQILSDYMPDYMQPRLGYISDEYVETVRERMQKRSLHVIYKREAYKYLVFIMTTVTYFLIETKKIVLTNYLLSFFRLSLFFYGAGYIMSIVPTGMRFLYLSNTFILSFFILFTNIQGALMLRRTIIWLSPFIIFLILVEIRMSMGYLGPMLFIGNFITASFSEFNKPIITIIKELFD